MNVIRLSTITVLVGALSGTPAALAFELNGVHLGAKEAEVKKVFPSAHCRALEWQSEAADRRCDDSRAPVIGMTTRVTFYIKSGAVQAFDVRFNTLEHDRVIVELKTRYGKPAREGRESEPQGRRPPREFLRVHWESGGQRARYSAEPGRKPGQLSAWRGEFDREIYRIR